MTDDDRIARLEARVDELAATVSDRLAARAADGTPEARVGEGEPVPPGAAGTFWALEGLKAREPEPGAVLFTGAVTLPDERHLEWQEAFPVADLLDGFDDDAATALAAVAHPVRLLLLRILLDGPRTVAELGEHERLGTSGQTYHHLRQLVGAGWLRTVARGRYGVPPERVVPLLTAIAAVRR